MAKTVEYDNLDLCPECNSLNDVKGKGTIDKRIICEAETKCVGCGHIDYWAYGWYESKGGNR